MHPVRTSGNESRGADPHSAALPRVQRAAASAHRLVRGIAGPVDVERSSSAVRSCEVLLIIGTSGIVYPAASFASLAKEAGAFVAEINLEQDCLRLYRLPDTQGCEVREHGKFKATDFDAPLVL